TNILEFADRPLISNEAKLLFSTGSLYLGSKPWIIDIIDSPFCLSGNNYSLFMSNKKKLEKILLQENCRKIIIAHETALSMFKKHFPYLISKTVLVRPAVKTSSFFIDKNKYSKHENYQLLFVGSINNPIDFYMKGGLEAIEVAEFLQNKGHSINLTIRCKLPEELRERVLNNKKIRLIEERIPYEEIVKLYTQSDILLFPSHTYVLMVFLESMYFGLPIISLDSYAVRDYVIDKETGFVVKRSDKYKFYSSPSYPVNLRTEEFFAEIKKGDYELVTRIADKVLLLIKNPMLRKQMAEKAMLRARKVFSIEKRNADLKKVFDEALEL
ncbi:MAG: glycosyltransferase family 4 protein, partial [Nanoarchaeota archaeon]